MLRILILVGFAALSQSAIKNNDYGNTLGVLNYTSEKVTYNFTFYPDNFTIRRTCKDSNACKSICPEILFVSLFSSMDYKWHNSLHFKADFIEDSTFKKLLSKRAESDHMQLICKMEFKSNDTEYAFVKFYLFHNNKVSTGCLLLKKTLSVWKIDSETKFQDLSKILYFYDNKYLREIFIERNSKDKVLNNAIFASYQNGLFRENIFIQDMIKNSGSALTKYKDSNSEYNIFE